MRFCANYVAQILLYENPAAVVQIIALGCDRLLTSGQQATAEIGIPLLKALVEQSASRIAVVAASGINEQNVENIIRLTNVDGVHLGSAVVGLVSSNGGGDDIAVQDNKGGDSCKPAAIQFGDKKSVSTEKVAEAYERIFNKFDKNA
jgi:copper homeostasis protein CutC